MIARYNAKVHNYLQTNGLVCSSTVISVQTLSFISDLEEALLIMYSPGAPQWEVVTAEEEIARALASTGYHY